MPRYPMDQSAMLDSEADTGTSKSLGVAPSAAQIAAMTAKEKAAYRKELASQIAKSSSNLDTLLTQTENQVNAIKANLGNVSNTDIASLQQQADFLMQQANEQAASAEIANQLAKSEADKADALKALEDAKRAADAAAAAAAAKAAAEKAALEAALKAANDAASKAALQNQLNALNASVAAAGNLNVSGNVFLPTTPSAGGMSAADILAKQYAEQQAAAEKQASIQRQNIIDVMTDRMKRYNLGSLVPTITRLAQEGASEATITLALQETPEYQMRFAANQERIKKGLQVLTPAEYLNVEDSYRQTLRAYGLTQFDTDQYVQQFIANDVSPSELSNRVVTAVQRVRNADPAITQTLRDYYGISANDLVAYVLDPNQQFPKIERQISAAEIGTAARRQGLEAGVAVSEQLAAQGISQAEAQKGYATIADILPTAEKLSAIYGTTEQAYTQSEAEQEVFNQLASAQRKRQRLTQREIAQFSGQVGTARTALSGQQQGQF